MSSQSEHNTKAVHNNKFYNSIKTDIYPDWAIITLFYKSVHLIESILATKNLHPNSHKERDDFMKDDTKLFSNEVRINYRELKNLSHQARYKPEYKITDENLNTAQQCIDVITSWHKKFN